MAVSEHHFVQSYKKTAKTTVAGLRSTLFGSLRKQCLDIIQYLFDVSAFDVFRSML